MKRILLLPILAVLAAGCAAKEDAIVLSGVIEATEADIYSEVSGRVVEILKDEGDMVAMGEVVAILDSSDAQAMVMQAEAGVKQAQAALDELMAGTRIEEVRQAEAALKIAEANLAEIRLGSRTEQIKQAEAVAKETEAYLEELKAGTSTEQIAQAELRLREAETNIEQSRETLKYCKDNLETVTILRNAGAAAEQELTDAANRYDVAERQLENAETERDIAVESLALLRRGATEQAVSAAQARYEQAEAALELLRSGATAQAVTAAEAAVEQSRAALEYTLNGASSERIAAAEAAVEMAQAGLLQAEQQTAKYQITAPTAGVVQYMGISKGQVIAAGRILATIQTDDYWIKVYVPQKYNGIVKPGQEYGLTASNMPDEPISATVVQVAAKAEYTPKNIETTEAKQEHTVFAVKLKINDHISDLNPGMTAKVRLEVIQ